MKNKSECFRDLIEKVYIVGLVVFILSSIFMSYFVYSNTMDIMFFKCLRYVALAVAILKICFFDLKTYSRKRMILTALLIVLISISGLVSRNMMLLWTIIMIVAAYKVDFERILRNLFIWETIIVVTIMLLSATGVIPDRVYSRGGETVRHSLGFKYSTYLPLFYLALSTIYLFLRKSKVRMFECLAIVVLSVVIYITTDTRLEPFLVTILAFGLYLYNKIGNSFFEKAINYIVMSIIPLAVIISGFSVVLYDSNNDVWRGINSFTSNRIGLSKKMVEKYGVTAFGNDIQWVGLSNIYEGENDSEYNAVDNAYLKLLVQFGVIAMILFVCSQANLFCLARIKGDYRLQLVLIIFVILSIVNPHTYELVFCPFLLLLGENDLEQKGRKADEDEKR